MARKSNAERQRLYRQKRDSDPERRQVYLRKEKDKYKADKEVGKKNSISERTPREQRKQRKLWKQYSRTYAAKQKARKNSDNLHQTPNVNKSSPGQCVSRQKYQAMKSAYESLEKKQIDLEEQNRQLSKSLSKVTKKAERYKKRSQRTSPKQNKPSTPRSKTKQLLSFHKDEKKTSLVKRTLEYHFALIDEMKQQSSKAKRVSLQSMASGAILKKYKFLERFRKDIKARPRSTRIKKGPKIHPSTKQHVRDFFLSSSVSRIAPGKRDTITRGKIKKQRRIMCDTMSNLYRKYVSSADIYISFTGFWRLKPFWVLPAREKDRKTCQCKKCENLEYLASALFRRGFIQSGKLSILIDQISCSKDNERCMRNMCSSCAQKDAILCQDLEKHIIVSYLQWELVSENRILKSKTEKTIRYSKRVEKRDSVCVVWNLFNRQLKDFKTHYFNMYTQFNYYALLKENLKSNECLIHIDFSENYETKWDKEIQSAHYGASKNQISLHTGFYLIGENNNVPQAYQSFCGISDSMNHGPTAIWVYLDHILSQIKDKHPQVTKLFFFSDGPTAQYRQKLNFYLFSKKLFRKGFKTSEWNFFEAGHGKGIPDGIGASVKRQADTSVRHGRSIQNAVDLLNCYQGSKIFEYIVTEDEINASALGSLQLRAVPQTMKIHQIRCSNPGEIYSRPTSCVCKLECSDLHEFSVHKFPVNEVENVGGILDSEACTISDTSPLDLNAGCEVEQEIDHCQLLRKMSESNVNKKESTICYSECLKRLYECNSFRELVDECAGQSIGMREICGSARNVLGTRLPVESRFKSFVPKDMPIGILGSQMLFPVHVRADGDCLPACGAVFAYGNDVNADEMRVRIIHELALHKKSYLNKSYFCFSDVSAEDMTEFFISTSDHYVPGVHSFNEYTLEELYKAEVMALSKPRSYMGFWEVMALSSVLKTAIFSVYPEVPNFRERRILHRTIEPRVKTNTCVLGILWTSTQGNPKSLYWRPNHFVPLLPFS